MKVGDIMKTQIVKIGPEESAAVAARTLTQYHVGVLPVCRENGRLCGVVTDRDLVTRCVAADRSPETTSVKTIMTGQVISVTPETETESAAALMEGKRIKRLPVVSDGKLCGMVSMADLSGMTEGAFSEWEAVIGVWRGDRESM